MIISNPLQESDDSPPANNHPYDTIIYIRLWRGCYGGKGLCRDCYGIHSPNPLKHQEASSDSARASLSLELSLSKSR